MPNDSAPSAPLLDIALTLLDAHAAFQRAIALDALQESITPVDTERFQLELDAANADVRLHAFQLQETIAANREWVNDTVGPAAAELFAGVTLAPDVAWLQHHDDDFASRWRQGLSDVIDAAVGRPTPCSVLAHHVLQELAVCTIMALACPFFVHNGVTMMEACAADPPPTH